MKLYREGSSTPPGGRGRRDRWSRFPSPRSRWDRYRSHKCQELRRRKRQSGEKKVRDWSMERVRPWLRQRRPQGLGEDRFAIRQAEPFCEPSVFTDSARFVKKKVVARLMLPVSEWSVTQGTHFANQGTTTKYYREGRPKPYRTLEFTTPLRSQCPGTDLRSFRSKKATHSEQKVL